MKSRNRFLIGLILISFVLAGCSKKDVVKHYYAFQGENESWSATYVEDGEVVFTEQDGTLGTDSWSNHAFEIEYKGDLSDLENVKHMEISYKSGRGGGNLFTDYSEDESPTSKIFSINGGTNSCRTFDKDHVIQVEVNLDGRVESFELALVNNGAEDSER